MVTLEKIDSALFANLYESFLIDDDPLSDEQDWRNVFDYAWPTPEGHRGYALLDQGKVVGMIGMVFSERSIAGSIKRFCNLHTWWVREDHRGRSLALLRPILKYDDYTITHFTPCDTVRAVSRRLGFQDLDSQLKILLPLGKHPKDQQEPNVTILGSEEEIESQLEPWDKRILVDHRPYGCGHLLLHDGDTYCYLLYTEVVRHRLPYLHIHFISNRTLFAKHEATVRRFLMDQHRVRFIAVDCRLVPETRFRRSFHFWAPAGGLFKSPDLGPESIDHLYSDVVFLKLTVLPNITHELQKRAARWWPFPRR